ncbi:MAG: penicillin-binding protein 2 [Rhodospirillaceae bacterium]|nr:penicillin-binding protein 2 [Rhodospirillaceae bacterium]
MDRDVERFRCLTRRTLVLGGLQLGLFGVLGARMYVLQVSERERYAMLAEENRINVRLIAPSRGTIVDRTGEPLAVNDQNFRVVMVAEQSGDVDTTLARLSDIVDLSDADIRRVLRDVERRPAFVPVNVIDNLNWRQVSRLEVNQPELPGLSIEVGELRRYPYVEATAHVLGYVGAVSENEMTGDPVLALPGFRIGKTGIEREYEHELRGEAGTSQVEVNAVGRVIRELARDEGLPGAQVQTTLDIGLQDYAQRRLAGEESASAVVMDIHTGEIFAMASHPSFDPNLFTTGIDSATWATLRDDPRGRLSNKTVNGQYAPGSTFKMLVALAGLESGVIGPNASVYCPGYLDLGNHRFHCWRHWGHGRLGLNQALAQSCDVFFYDIARRIGIDTIAEMASRFGIGAPVGIDLPHESTGLMPNRAWKERQFDRPWQQGETLVASIGQGYVLATPLQLCVMVARMVNGGRAVRPHLAMRVGGPDGAPVDPPAPDLGIDPLWLGEVTRGMIAVTSDPRGTARGAQIPEEGMQMGGKTGTSQVRRITMAERMTGIIPNDQRPWDDRDHALFVGFAPVDAPRYAVAVVVEHGGGGSAVAAPIARDLLWETQRRAPGRPLTPEQTVATPGLGPPTGEG